MTACRRVVKTRFRIIDYMIYCTESGNLHLFLLPLLIRTKRVSPDVVRVDVNFALKQWEQVRRIMTYNPVPKYEAPVYEGKLLDTDALYEPFVSNYSFTDGVVEVFMLLNFTYESSMFDNYEYYPPA